jgi:hypothetical protein
MPRTALTRRLAAISQAMPDPKLTPPWDIRRLSDAELEALMPLAARLEQEGPSVQWQPDEVLLLEHAWIVATTERREETSCRR